MQERDQDRIVHEFVYDASSFGKLGGMRRVWTTGHPQEAIANLSRNVHLARRTWYYVNLHQLLPPCAHPFPTVIRGVGFGKGLFVDGGIALRVQRELERLHAVVLREIGHEGAQCPWRGSGVEKNLVERRRTTRHGVPG